MMTTVGGKKLLAGLSLLLQVFMASQSLARCRGQRDNETPHRFAESVVTLGEFVMPYRAKSLDDMLWRYYVDLKNNLYLCQQQQKEGQE